MKFVFLAASLLATLLPAHAAYAADPYEIVFPVDGENSYSNTFGDPRGGGRTHEGEDIRAEKMTPVVAAASGTVGWVHDVVGGNCCAMELIHDDGFRSRYIHLNNDTPGTDDGQGWGFAPGIATGVHVEAGQVIGYVGDSGNAEGTYAHLHFELRDSANAAFDPYPSLVEAEARAMWNPDEMFFYRQDGLYAFYETTPGGELGAALVSGNGYTQGWSTITAVDLEGDGQDEMFFYRDDGLFRFYNVRSDGSLPSPMVAGSGYTTGWDAITAVDLDGDGQDEMFFYRDDGLFRFYNVRADGSLPSPMVAGSGYTTGWDAITAVDLDGDGQDEMFFYRDDGLFRFYNVRADGSLPSPMLAGSDYTAGWSALSAVDLDGDGQDEMFFYRTDGLFGYYDVSSAGFLGEPILSGSDYTIGWDSISSIQLD